MSSHNTIPIFLLLYKDGAIRPYSFFWSGMNEHNDDRNLVCNFRKNICLIVLFLLTRIVLITCPGFNKGNEFLNPKFTMNISRKTVIGDCSEVPEKSSRCHLNFLSVMLSGPPLDCGNLPSLFRFDQGSSKTGQGVGMMVANTIGDRRLADQAGILHYRRFRFFRYMHIGDS